MKEKARRRRAGRGRRRLATWMGALSALLLLGLGFSPTAQASWYLDAQGRLPARLPLTTTWHPAGPAAPGRAAPQPARPASGALRTDEARLLELINQARVQAGVRPLAVDAALERLAEQKADEMAALGYFDHRSPTRGTPLEMERAAGIRAAWMGAENIARARDVEFAMAMFMGSAPHRANLLDPRFDTAGVGVAPTARGVAVSVLFLGH
ncbi:MAG: CAP domain-containing protein [Bacillota bacterium]|nr:CAP domain-containing protein [Bacillota bacterium]